MRIIGGTARGRRLQTPSKSVAKHPGHPIRPTSDRAREALFNIIGEEIRDAFVLDLFAGTGALGLEALSRAARQAVFVDNSPEALRLIEKNINLCGFSDRAFVCKRDLSKGLYFLGKLLPEAEFSVIFIDPPYRKGLAAAILDELGEMDFLSDGGLVVVEEDAFTDMAAMTGSLRLTDRRRYGEAGIWFYRKTPWVEDESI